MESSVIYVWGGNKSPYIDSSPTEPPIDVLTSRQLSLSQFSVKTERVTKRSRGKPRC